MISAQANPAIAVDYRQRLEELAEALRADSRQPGPQSRERLREAYERLPHFPGGRPLRMAVRQAISYPNQMLTASAEFLNHEARRKKVGMATNVHKKSSGTTITGRADTKGQAAIVLHPNEAEAEIELQFRGQTQSRLTGSKGPVNVFECGHADLFATDVGYLSAADGVRTSPACDVRPQ